MKTSILICLFIIGATNFSLAASQSEETCKEQVKSVLATFSSTEDQSGNKKDLNGLTKEDIEEMLKRKSYCEVYQEIFRRITK